MTEISIGEEGKREIIKRGTTLTDIIKEKGRSGESLRSIIDTMLPDWHKHVLPKAKELFAKPPPDFMRDEKRGGLKVPPIRRVDLGDASVHILGVNHGLTESSSHQSDYSKVIKEFVEYTNQNEGYIWMTEEGLDRAFGVMESADSLEDMTEYMQRIDEDLDRKKKEKTDKPGNFFKRAWRTMQLVRTNLQDQLDMRRGNTSFTSPELKALITPLTSSVMKQDTQSILLWQQYFNTTKLPEPLDMEASFVLTYGDKTDKPSLMMDRSYIQARQLEQIIKAHKELRVSNHEGDAEGKKPTYLNVGLLTGHLHASQIEYFLTHPTYEPHKSLAEAKQRIKQESPQQQSSP